MTSLKLKNVENMSHMFKDCDLTNINISLLDTKNTKYMKSMFSGCNLTNTNFSSFNTNNVTNMEEMFSFCQSLTKLIFLTLILIM